MDWTQRTWRLLCLLTVTSGLAAGSGLLWTLSPLWQALAVAPGLLVVLLVCVASWADSQQRLGVLEAVTADGCEE